MMKNTIRIFVVLISLLVISFFVSPFYNDATASMVPGWHTTISPKYIKTLFLIIGLLLLDAYVFRIVLKSDYFKQKKVIISHGIVSIILIVLIRYPEIYFPEVNDIKNIRAAMDLLYKITYLICAFYILQLLYFIYLAIIFTKSKPLHEKP